MPLTEEQKRANKEARREELRMQKLLDRQTAERNQKPVESLTISIEWKKSRMWGNNPHAEVAVNFQDGTFERRDGYTASGCGYDKESTVIAAIFNDFLKYKLYQELDGNPPYGMYYKVPGQPSFRSYNGGVGTSCYYRIAEFIGGTFENLASGKAFDVYKYTDKPKVESETETEHKTD